MRSPHRRAVSTHGRRRDRQNRPPPAAGRRL